MTTIDVKALAEQADMPVAWISDDGVLKWKELEAFAALVLEAAALECERIFNAPESEGGCAGWDSYYTRPYLHCAELVRAMKPGKEPT